MSVLSDRDITDLCLVEEDGYQRRVDHPMIEPFVDRQIRYEQMPTYDVHGRASGHTIDGPKKIMSYGLSSAGYDVRLDRQFKIFKNTKTQLIDPLDIRDDYYDDHEGDFVVIPGNGYILGITMETFDIPRDILGRVLGKSSLARLGAHVNCTPIEPGWKGKVVIEIANSSSVPLKIYAGMGVAQFIFERLTSPCKVSYNDRQGKYQGQNSLQTALL